MELSLHPRRPHTGRNRRLGNIAFVAVLCFSLVASACSVGGGDTVVQTADADSMQNEVAGVMAQASGDGSRNDDGSSSALGFRLDPSLDASLSSAQLGFELDDSAADDPGTTVIASATDSDTSDASDGTAAAATAGTDDVAQSEWVPASDGEEAAANESSAASPDVYSGPLEDIPPGPGAPAVWVGTAKDSTGYVQLYDAPNGTPISATYQYLDGSTMEYQVWNPTFFGGPLSLLVVGGNPETDDFVQVQLPVRPSGSTAWIQTDQFEYFLNDHYVEIDVATNTVRAWKGNELLLDSIAVTGRPDRPTPLVRTYIDEKLAGPNSAYGPWMLTLAAFSESLNTFGAGLPKLAVHGTNQPELMGQYASSGCIRLPNDVINQLAELVPVGTRVDIVRS